MSSSRNTQAIVLFAKRPEIGKVKTRLAAGVGHERALAIYCRMVELTAWHAVAVEDATPWMCFSPDEADAFFAEWMGANWQRMPQVAGDLGARMQAVFDAAIADRTIIVGTDCPGVDAPLLTRAFAALDEADVVLGPTFDGGYYLIGAKRSHPELFADMPWSTEQVLPETLRRGADMGLHVVQLATLSDVDAAEDLQNYPELDL